MKKSKTFFENIEELNNFINQIQKNGGRSFRADNLSGHQIEFLKGYGFDVYENEGGREGTIIYTVAWGKQEYKIDEKLKDRLIECIQGNLSISTANNHGGNDFFCAYCYAERSESGRIEHTEDCEGTVLIEELNSLESE